MNLALVLFSSFLSLNALAQTHEQMGIQTPVHASCRGSLGSIEMNSDQQTISYTLVYQGQTTTQTFAPIDNGQVYSSGGSASVLANVDHPQDFWVSIGGSKGAYVTVPGEYHCVHSRVDACRSVWVPEHSEQRVTDFADLMINILSPGVYQFNRIDLGDTVIDSLGADTVCSVSGI